MTHRADQDAAVAAHRDAVAKLQAAKDHKSRAIAALAAKQNDRKNLALAAAMGDAASVKKLKIATLDRNDAAQLEEDMGLAVQSAEEGVRATENIIIRCRNITDLADLRNLYASRLGYWAAVENHRDAMFEALSALGPLRVEIATILRRIDPTITNELAPGFKLIDMQRYHNMDDNARFAQFLVEGMDQAIFRELPEHRLTLRGTPSRVEFDAAQYLPPLKKEDKPK